MGKCITLFTDAGFCPNTNIGTWAAWAKFDNNQTMRFSGVLKGFVHNSDVAELRAMANGIHCAVSFFKPPQGTIMIVQCDCQNAIGAIIGTAYKNKTNEQIKDALKTIKETQIRNKLSIRCRHVGSHKGYRDKRSAVNTWCDKECYSHLKKAREQHGLNSTTNRSDT